MEKSTMHKPFATNGCGDHPCFHMPVQREQLIRKALAMIKAELLGDAYKMKITLLTALHPIVEAWKHITPATIQNCLKKYRVLSDGEHI
jgi:hypothetical protein